MNLMFFKRVVTTLVVVAKILAPVVYLISTTAQAQAPDTEPPSIGEDTISEARKGDSQVFSVSATDNDVITSIDIFYRLGSDASYIKSSMSQVGNTDLYSFTIPADSIPESVDVIQYYIEARDNSGNRTLHGFSFSPRERKLVDLSDTIADTSTSEENTSEAQDSSPTLLGSLSTTEKVVYGGLAILVVGALVSAAGSGGDDNESGLTEVTLVVDLPQ